MSRTGAKDADTRFGQELCRLKPESDEGKSDRIKKSDPSTKAC